MSHDGTRPGGGHYFSPVPDVVSDPRAVALDVAGRRLRLATDRGVFAYGRLDPGTRVLLDLAPPPTGGTLLDVGCGVGPIALTLATLAPGATVYAVDVNERARDLTAENAAAAGLGNVVVTTPDGVPPELAFDTIWSNPPVRVGADVLRPLLARWFDRLAPAGEAWLVVQRNLGADALVRWLAGQGYAAVRVRSRKGFGVIRVPSRKARGSA
ncbi:MAG: class I SAM-dependent methyltransferase [Mycobacteriales bacterium]